MLSLTVTQNTLLLRFVRLMIRMDGLPAARRLLGKGVLPESWQRVRASRKPAIDARDAPTRADGE